jgi:hypothetical protein
VIKHVITRGIPGKMENEVVIFYLLLFASQYRGPICVVAREEVVSMQKICRERAH